MAISVSCCPYQSLCNLSATLDILVVSSTCEVTQMLCYCNVVFDQNYCVKGLELFSSYLFKDILELYDWNLTGNKHTHTQLYINTLLARGANSCHIAIVIQFCCHTGPEENGPSGCQKFHFMPRFVRFLPGEF